MSESDIAQQLRHVVASLPSGEVRDGQLRMAEAVARALETGGHLAVAAGTGTGKSLAYLVPAVRCHKRVVVATATKALQDQLANKDLPLVKLGLGRPVKWAVLKGRANYLCRQRLRELERLGEQQRLDAPDAGTPEGGGEPGTAQAGGALSAKKSGSGGSARAIAAHQVGEEVRRLAAWAGSTGSGDRAELDFEPSRRRGRASASRQRSAPGRAVVLRAGSASPRWLVRKRRPPTS